MKQGADAAHESALISIGRREVSLRREELHMKNLRLLGGGGGHRAVGCNEREIQEEL
jgi:hypothetical protein